LFLFDETTVNEEVWGANMRAYGGRILLGFSILWNLKILWWVFGV